MDNFLIQAGYKMEFSEEQDASKETGTWLAIGSGISSMEPAGNDEVDQTSYYDNGGMMSSDVIGGQEIFSFGGHRDYDDAFLNAVYNKIKHTRGTGRKGTLHIVYPDGAELLGNCTIANIEGPGGEGNAKGEISFEIHINGEPAITEPPLT
ncbi:MAG: hypothetical protein L0J63_01200 [Tetragenococcus koreensis]|nr:hypothetical protein [Tetragenococcus koreensis]